MYTFLAQLPPYTVLLVQIIGICIEKVNGCVHAQHLYSPYSNTFSTSSSFSRIRSLQRLPMLPSWVWCTSRVGL